MADALAPPQPPSLRRFFRLGLVCHTALIACISAAAYAGVIPTKVAVFPEFDLVMHLVLVGTWGFFLDGALGHRVLVTVPFVPRLGPGVALALAATEEYLQRFSPRRSSTWSDFAANATGILIGAWLARRLTIARAARRPAPGEEGGRRATDHGLNTIHDTASSAPGSGEKEEVA